MDKVPAKYRFRKSDSKRQNSGKDTHALPRRDRDWRRVVAIEVMHISGDNVCEKLGFFKGNVKKVVTFSLKSQIYKHITHSSDNSIITVKLPFCPIWISFTSRTWANIRGGRGEGRKPKLREERRNERHKSSENAQEK